MNGRSGRDEWRSHDPRSEAKNSFPTADLEKTLRGWKIAQPGAASLTGTPIAPR